MKYHSSGYITCEQLIELIADYLSGEIDAEARGELERHLAVCPACINYLKTYKQTIQLGKAAFQGEESPGAPAEKAPEELIDAILAEWRKRK